MQYNTLNIKEILLFILVSFLFVLCALNKSHINSIEKQLSEPNVIEAPVLEKGLKTYFDDRPFKPQNLPGELDD